MRYFGLGDAVISLRGVGLAKCGLYDADKCYVHFSVRTNYDAKRAINIRRALCLDLNTGLMYESKLAEADNYFTKNDLPSGMGQNDVVWNDNGDHWWYRDASEVVVRLILALTSHQVEGDQILKGLRLIEHDIPNSVKFTSNYLGGWNVDFTGVDGGLSLAGLINVLLGRTGK